MIFDRISNKSILKNINPIQKFIFCMGIIFLLLINEKSMVFYFNLIVFNFILLFILKIGFKNFFRIYLMPFYFILSSVIILILNKSDYLIFILKSFSSISVIYFLLASTLITDMDYVFEKLKFPVIFRELFSLIYRYIFLLNTMKNDINISQKSRLGKFDLNSVSMLVSSLFKKSFYHSINSTNAAEARLGNLFLFKSRKYEKNIKVTIIGIFILLINIYLVVFYV